MRRRTQARECALRILYQADVTRRAIDAAATHYWDDGELKDEEERNEEVITFANKYYSGVAMRDHGNVAGYRMPGAPQREPPLPR